MKNFRLFLILMLFGTIDLRAQVIVYQDVLRGGITGGGVNFGLSSGTLNFSVNIEPASTIKKAMFIATADGIPNDLTLSLNGINYTLNNQSAITKDFLSIYLTPPTSSVHMIDITKNVDPQVTNYTVSIPAQPSLTFERFYQFYVVIVYENLSLPPLACVVVLNSKDVSNVTNYNLSGLLAINNTFPVGYAVLGNHFCNIFIDGSFVEVNTNPVGLIGGEDINSPTFCSGVSGHFYYQNNTLYGLSDDTPDIFMNGTDALANIQSYVNNNDTQIDLGFFYQTPGNPDGSLSNPVIAVFLAYTTTCDTFSVQTFKDTTVCFGSELQLNASGGVKYLWSPSVGLSCDTCANPVFTADSTIFYTVRVWNNDSCSVVRPVHVIVKNERGKAPDVSVSASNCGDSTGVATASVSPSGNVVSWQTVGGTPQSSPILQNLAPGFHTVFYTDINGCQSLDTTIFIPTVNPFTVSFVANPPNGAAPLSVDFVNTSVSASNFEWFINGQFVGNSLTNFVFDTIGLYTVSLVGWQNNVLCIDTVSVQIFVFDSLIVTLPNVFTPNGDGVNELLTITTNQDVTYEFSIQNRWGNTLITGNGALQKSIPQPIWDGNDASDGVYFVLLKFTQIDGKEIKAQGFVQVFGR